MDGGYPGGMEPGEVRRLEDRIEAVNRESMLRIEAVNREGQLRTEAILERIDGRFAAVDARFATMETRFDAIESRFDAKFEAIGMRLDSMEKFSDVRFGAIERSTAGLRTTIVTTGIAAVLAILFGIVGCLIGLKQVWIGGVQVGQASQAVLRSAP